MPKDHKMEPPRKNEYLLEDVADLLFDDGETEVMLSPKQLVAVRLEYLGGGKPVSQATCDKFLHALCSGMSKTKAAQYAGASYSTFHRLAKANEVFAEALREAEEIRAVVLEETSIEQATEGVKTHNGLTFPTNPQLQMHVRAANPDKFRDRSEVVNRNGPDVKPIRNPGDREKLMELINKYGVKPSDNVDDLL